MSSHLIIPTILLMVFIEPSSLLNLLSDAELAQLDTKKVVPLVMDHIAQVEWRRGKHLESIGYVGRSAPMCAQKCALRPECHFINVKRMEKGVLCELYSEDGNPESMTLVKSELCEVDNLEDIKTLLEEENFFHRS